MINRKIQIFTRIKPFLQGLLVTGFLYLSAGFSGCDFNRTKEEPVEIWDSLTVTASAYNSLGYQTGPGDPSVTAWGDTIEPGMKVIAVSRDLIEKGLDHNTRVKIEGFEGEFLVKDKMHYRWKNKIDIYMGEDVQKARKWGRKKVKITYQIIPADTLQAPQD
jgi:3D (Asp-Asp-Asp) domain-containing protein